MLSTIRKVYDLFDRGERRQLAGLFGLSVLVALLQMVGIASIMPFMSLVANPGIITESQWAQWLYVSFGFESTKAFLLFAGMLVLGIMVVSNAVTAFSSWMMLRFVREREYRLSVRLLDKYLHEPFTFYLNRNTSTLAKTILSEVGEVIKRVFVPGMRMFTQGIVALCIVTLLLLADVQLALFTALVLGGIYGGLYAAIRTRQRRWGKVRKTTNRLRFKTATEALGGIKETKVLGREEEFLRRFSVPAQDFAKANTANAVVTELPKYALDTVAFGGILLLVLYVIYTREDFAQSVGILSLYAFAAYRLKPALQEILNGMASIRFFGAVLDELHEDLFAGAAGEARHELVADRGEPLTYEYEIGIERICYRYPETEEDVLHNVSLRIRKNTSVGFVGSTGSGKTTLSDIIVGLLEPQQGTVRVDGVPITARNLTRWRQKLGYVPQHIYLYDDSIVRNIAFGIPDEKIDFEAVERCARIAHLHDFVMSLPRGYSTVVGERGTRLSGGQRQRIGLARALYHDPDVLVMDEATSALDGITEGAVMQAIHDLSCQKTIILVAHRLATVQSCDLVHFFDRGEIVASGSYAELIHSNVSFRAMARLGSLEAVAS